MALDIESMLVLCSDGRGELTARACLYCSLSRSNTCGYDYVLLKSLFDQQDRSTSIHVTDLLGCPKRTFLGKTAPVAEYVHDKLTRSLGINQHSALELSDEHVDCELKLNDGDLVGTADIVFKNGRIVDTKTSRWIYPDKLPYSSHSEQVNVYAHMLRKMGREVTSAAIQYIDMSGPTKCRKCRMTVRQVDGYIACPKCGETPNNAHLGAVLVEIPLWDPDYTQRFVNERVEGLRMAMASGIVPDAEPGFLCNYCSFAPDCPSADIS